MERRRSLPLLLTFISVLTSWSVRAQNYNISASGAEGILIKKDASMRRLIQTTSSEYYLVAGGWTATGDSVNVFDELWGRPTLEGGVMLGDFHRIRLHDATREPVRDVGYMSGLGTMITPYIAFRRPLLRSRRFEVGYKFENGVGISTRPYDMETNAENELIGSKVSVFFGLGVYGAWNVTKNLQVGIDAGFRHYSNGKLDQPNIGINTVDVGLRATYRIEPDTVVRRVYNVGIDKGWKRHLYADINVGWNPQTLLSDWIYDYMQEPADRRRHYKSYNAWTLSGALMWRYCRKYASGIGLDYTYMPFMDDVEASEDRLQKKVDYKLSPHVLGISLHHETFYKNMSLYVSLGYFLQKRLGATFDANQKRYYETFGLRWYMPFLQKRGYISYHINACAIKANSLQFNVGFCPWKHD